jgi:hypothetical protein
MKKAHDEDMSVTTSKLGQYQGGEESRTRERARKEKTDSIQNGLCDLTETFGTGRDVNIPPVVADSVDGRDESGRSATKHPTSREPNAETAHSISKRPCKAGMKGKKGTNSTRFPDLAAASTSAMGICRSVMVMSDAEGRPGRVSDSDSGEEWERRREMMESRVTPYGRRIRSGLMQRWVE